MQVTLVLAPRAGGLLRSRAQAAAQGRGYTSRATFIAEHAPLTADYDKLRAYLTAAKGVQVTRVAGDRFTLGVDASVGDIQRLFGTTINVYSWKGRQFYANASNPKLPASLAPLLQRIGGLANAAEIRPHLIKHSQGSPGSTPYAPADIRAAYNVTSLLSAGLNGSGQTIGIVTLAPFNPTDVSQFVANLEPAAWPQPSVTRVQNLGPTLSTCGGGNDETTLDVEWSSAMAPGAAIKTFEGTDCDDSDFYAAIAAAVADPSVKVISTSWGLCEAYSEPSFISSVDSLLAGATAQGKSFFAASGDDGSYDCDTSSIDATISVDYPGVSPYITSVGGTSLRLDSSAGWSSESAWSCSDSSSCNRSGTGGSGGGCSRDWRSSGGPPPEPEPSWQQGLTSCGARAVPDVSANADPSTGYAIYYGSVQGGWGGTSFAAPVWAGIMADVNQGRVARGVGVAGQANSSLYTAAKASSAAFHDIPAGGTNGAFFTGAGWDHVTGWGSPNAYNLAQAMGAVAASAATLTAPSSAPSGSTVTVSWSGISNASGWDWIGLFSSGTPNDGSAAAYNGRASYIYAQSRPACSTGYISPEPAGVASGSCTYTLPTTPGTYEFRLESDASWAQLATSGTVTVLAGSNAASTATATAVPTATPTAASGARLTVPSSAAPGSTITVSWSGIANASGWDWIGLFTPGTPNDGSTAAYNGRLSYIFDRSNPTCSTGYISPEPSGLASGSCTYALPSTPGTYEFRLESNGSWSELASATINISGVAATPTPTSAAGLSVPSSAAPGGTVTVSWSGISNASGWDWIGLFTAGAPNDGSTAAYNGRLSYIFDQSNPPCSTAYISPKPAGESSGSCTYTLPSTSGTYEFRLEGDGSWNQLASATITVTSGPTPTPTATSTAGLSAPSAAAAGSSVTVSWSGISNASGWDWIGLFTSGTPNDGSTAAYNGRVSYIFDQSNPPCSTGYISPKPSGESSGSCSYRLPSTPGTYELRLEGDGAWNLLSRASITVQ